MIIPDHQKTSNSITYAILHETEAYQSDVKTALYLPKGEILKILLKNITTYNF